MNLENVIYRQNFDGEIYGVCKSCAGTVPFEQLEHQCGEPDELGIICLMSLGLPVGEFLARSLLPEA